MRSAPLPVHLAQRDAQAMVFPPITAGAFVFGHAHFISVGGRARLVLPHHKLGRSLSRMRTSAYEHPGGASGAHLRNARLAASLQRKAAELENRVMERRGSETEVRELNAKLEQRVLERTAELEAANRGAGNPFHIRFRISARAARHINGSRSC